jgi:UDP-glucose 4-epimerase
VGINLGGWFMNCVVFGGGGFIGSHICHELVSNGYNVKAFGRSEPRYLSKDVEWYHGDFCKSEDVSRVLSDNTETIIHVISSTIPSTSNQSPSLDIETNVQPTLRMLDIAVKKKVKKVIFISSGGTIYGIPKEIPIKEIHSTEPISSYGIHKLTIEKYLGLYKYLYNLSYTILRVSNPYGFGQPIDGQQGAIGIFINKAILGEPIEIWGDGSVIRDYIYVTDVAKAVRFSISHTSEQNLFNIGSGEGRSLLNVLSEIKLQLQTELKVVFKESRKSDVSSNVLDINLAKEMLLWKPELTFKEGLSRTIDYFNKTKQY